jgi:hypothetical protein
MKTLKLAGLALLLLSSMVLAADKKEKKPKVPEVINQARLVFVQSADGEETRPGLASEDFQAVTNVRILLRNWGRYMFTDDRSKADLIFVVHTARGRTEMGGGGGGYGRGSQGAGSGMGAPGAAGMPAPQGGQFPGTGRDSASIEDTSGFDVDRLEVCQLKPNGKLAGALWSRSMEGGLAPPRVLLFAQFKEDVERAYPGTAASAPRATDQ